MLHESIVISLRSATLLFQSFCSALVSFPIKLSICQSEFSLTTRNRANAHLSILSPLDNLPIYVNLLPGILSGGRDPSLNVS